jgi:hypothetical protein
VEPMHLRIFQAQVELQCRTVIFAAQDVERALRLPDAALTWSAIQNLLTAAANISKALWGQGGKLAVEREPLRASLGIADTSPLREVAMRNHFEHFDERLDRWWDTSANHIYVDMAVGPRGRTVSGPAESDMFRQFDPTTGEVIFWGERFNLQEIVSEAERLLPIVHAEASKPHWEAPNVSGGGQ